MLSKPSGSALIPLGTLGYFRGRNRWRIYAFVLSEFQKSGLTKAELARRMGKRPEVISRLLGAPGNWGLDTVSDLLFAISGGEPAYGIAHPLDDPARNDTQPNWLTDYGWTEKIQKPIGQTPDWTKLIASSAGLQNESKQHNPQSRDSSVYSGVGGAGD